MTETVRAVWTPSFGVPECSRQGCAARPTKRVLILDPDGKPEPLGRDDYCDTHAAELARMLKHYGPGRPGYRVEAIT